MTIRLNISQSHLLDDSFVNASNYSSIQAALTASKYVYIPAGTYSITGTLTPQLNSVILGQGVGNTILDFEDYNGICLYAPGQQGSLSGFTIKGNSKANSIGLQVDKTHRPYHCSWGEIKIIGFNTGLLIYNDGTGEQGFYGNDFGNIWTESCVNGVIIQATSQIINANLFRMLSAINCTNGVYLENVGGMLIEFLHVESGTLGLNVVKGLNINILDGHLEGLTTNIQVANNPDVMGFRYWGTSDEADSNYIYTTSDNRSDLLSFAGAYYRMGGRWWFDTLEATKTYALTLRSPNGTRYSINVSDVGALLIQAI